MKLKFTVLFVLFTLCVPSYAIITHGDYYSVPNPGEVVGKWGSNASCVAVGDQLVLTTKHQGGGIGTSITIAGQNYIAAEISDFGSADLRLVRLETAQGQRASLSDYVSVYSGNREQDYVATIGGFGRISGATLANQGVEYGYAWGAMSSEIVWGTNKVSAISSSAITGNFNEMGSYHSTEFEAAPALGDSGGGWFFQADGQWYVAGLFRSVERLNETWYKNSYAPYSAHADSFSALRVSNYASVIDIAALKMVPEPMTMAMFACGMLAVTMGKRRNECND